MSWLNKLFSFERDLQGNTWWEEIGSNDVDWELGDQLQALLNNPIAFRCVDLIADLFSQAKFGIDGEEADKDPLIQRLNNPNVFQSKQDFLKEYIFFKYAYGWVYQYPIKPEGIKEPSALYNLNPAKVRYDKTFRTRLIFEKSEIDKAKQSQFKYEEDEQWQMFNINQVIPFFDIANGLSNDFLLKAPSRLKSIQKNIININTALASEKNALEKAGRFIVSGSTKGQITNRPLDPKEKGDIENSINGYGTAGRKGNVSVTNSHVEATSLHIPMNQLGIPESIASNSMHIMGVFGVPRELYPLDKSGATYENQKQATINLIQNVVQNEVNDFCSSYSSFFETPKPLTGSLDHLSAMQYIEEMKADKALKISTAIRNLAGTTINPEEFLETMGINMNQDG